MCRDTGQPEAAIRPRCAMIRRWGPRYVRHSARVRPTIRLRGPATLLGHDTAPLRHDTAECALPGFSACGLCAQAGPGCAPGAPNPVLTQCIVLSHCLGHCS